MADANPQPHLSTTEAALNEQVRFLSGQVFALSRLVDKGNVEAAQMKATIEAQTKIIGDLEKQAAAEATPAAEE